MNAPDTTFELTRDLDAFAEWMTRVVDTLDTFGRLLTNTPTVVAGLEARYYVRAGLDPNCDPNQLIQSILAGTADDTSLLSRANRAIVAAAAARGAAVHRVTGEASVFWHRLVGESRLEVAAA